MGFSADKVLHDPNVQIHYTIDVDDLDGLYLSLNPQLDQLAVGRVCAPFCTDYGCRNFHDIGETILLLSFGQVI